MTHKEGQAEELVLSQAEQETVEEELLETVTGGGLKDLFRCCLRPQTQETAPQTQQTTGGSVVRDFDGRHVSMGEADSVMQQIHGLYVQRQPSTSEPLMGHSTVFPASVRPQPR